MSQVDVVEFFKALSPADRVEILSDIGLNWCEHCGYEQPKNSYCQCNNDE